MVKKAAMFITAFLIAAAGIPYAGDTTFRCADDLIEEGYSMIQVQNSCGAPDSQMVIGQPERSGIIITQWVYKRDFGAYVLTFAGSKLIKKEFQRF
jgi:uncharacterized protein YbjT (DUF2867 family)